MPDISERVLAAVTGYDAAFRYGRRLGVPEVGGAWMPTDSAEAEVQRPVDGRSRAAGVMGWARRFPYKFERGA